MILERAEGWGNDALRHTAGTLSYLHSNDPRAVQGFPGHADPRMTAVHSGEGGVWIDARGLVAN